MGADITVKSKIATLQAGRPLSSTRVQDTIGWIVLKGGRRLESGSQVQAWPPRFSSILRTRRVTVEGEHLGAKLVSGDEDL